MRDIPWRWIDEVEASILELTDLICVCATEIGEVFPSVTLSNVAILGMNSCRGVEVARGPGDAVFDVSGCNFVPFRIDGFGQSLSE